MSTHQINKPGTLFVAEKKSGTKKWVGVLTFTSLDLRGIADALGPNDTGGEEMYELADWLDELNSPFIPEGDDDDGPH